MTNITEPTRKPKSSKLAKEQYWRDQIKAYRSSGKPAKQWSKENGVNVHTLTSWITKLGLQRHANKNNKSRDEKHLIDTMTIIQPKSQDQQPQTKIQLPHKSHVHSEEVVKIKHGAITITAETGYNKETLLSLIQILLTAKS